MSNGHIYCPQCGEAVLPEEKFCLKCGTQMPSAERLATPTSQAMPGLSQPASNDAPVATANQAVTMAAPAQTIAGSATPVPANPDKPVAVSDKYIWGLACAPFMGTLLAAFTVGFILGIIHNGSNGSFDADYDAIYPKAQIVLCLILNIFFLTKDMNEIKKSGQDAESWMWLGLILVPVYIGVRESKTNKNYWPLLVNILLLIMF